MILTAKARALLHGSYAVTPDDIEAVAFPVLRHRILMNFKAEAEGVTPDQVTSSILEQLQKTKSQLIQ
jgi:MoxR-like ATPase